MRFQSIRVFSEQLYVKHIILNYSSKKMYTYFAFFLRDNNIGSKNIAKASEF